jgi:hypothetical protein
MARYAIHRTDLGSAVARPVRGVIEVSDLPAADFTTRLADQLALLAVNEAAIQIPETAAFADLDSDASTYDYTVDTTATPPVALTPVTVDRYTLAQKQGFVRERRELLIAEAVRASHFDRYISDADLATFASYISALRGISDSEANPDGVVWPTLGAIAGAADRVLTRQYRRDNILSAVGFSGSVPTGGIIETETNINGLAMRFADGGQICRARILPGYFSNQRLVTSWTFPAAFYSAASYSFLATFSARNNANAADGIADIAIRQCEVISFGRTTTSIDIQVMSPTYSFVSGDDVWLDITAIGRWSL